MKRVLPLLVLSSATLLAQQPSIPGSWAITGDVQGYPISETCTFNQASDKLSGSCVDTNGKTYQTTVTIDGKKVTFVHGGEYEGQDLTLTYTGTLNDKGEIAGSIDVQPLNYPGTFTAKKSETK